MRLLWRGRDCLGLSSGREVPLGMEFSGMGQKILDQRLAPIEHLVVTDWGGRLGDSLAL